MSRPGADTIEVSSDLIAAAERFAATTHQSVGEVAEKALRAYMDADPELEALRKYHRERAAEAGLTHDEYVERLVNEARAEKRSESA